MTGDQMSTYELIALAALLAAWGVALALYMPTVGYLHEEETKPEPHEPETEYDDAA